jgi:hypothetical protein
MEGNQGRDNRVNWIDGEQYERYNRYHKHLKIKNDLLYRLKQEGNFKTRKEVQELMELNMILYGKL